MMWIKGMIFIMSVGGFTGCENQMSEPTSEQAALGQGIVEGTKGYQQLLEDPTMWNEVVTKVRGRGGLCGPYGNSGRSSASGG